MNPEGKHYSFIDAIAMILCILTASFALYAYIDKQNDLTEMRRRIPVLEKEVNAISEQNRRLQYEIDRFESPLHLMELSRKPEYSHLKYPMLNEVILMFDEEEKQHASR